MQTQINILTATKKLYPDINFFNASRIGMFDKAMGTDRVRMAVQKGESPESIISSWQQKLSEFKIKSRKYYLY